MRPTTLLIGLGIACTALGCAAKRPVLYPNYQLQRVGDARAQEDIDGCLEFAKTNGLDAQPERRAAQQSATGAAVGSAVGAATGAVWGRAGRGAATGAAGGGAGGLMRGLLRWRDPDPIQAHFVNVCLGDQGYRVIGWR
jgi:outer membrane lipoprotein SlyB